MVDWMSVLGTSHVFMKICAADSYVGWLDDDLPIAAFWNGDVVFDADVFFAVVACRLHLVGSRLWPVK